MFIPNPDLDFLSRLPDPRIKKAPDPGSGSATQSTIAKKIEENSALFAPAWLSSWTALTTICAVWMLARPSSLRNMVLPRGVRDIRLPSSQDSTSWYTPGSAEEQSAHTRSSRPRSSPVQKRKNSIANLTCTGTCIKQTKGKMGAVAELIVRWHAAKQARG